MYVVTCRRCVRNLLHPPALPVCGILPPSRRLNNTLFKPILVQRRPTTGKVALVRSVALLLGTVAVARY